MLEKGMRKIKRERKEVVPTENFRQERKEFI